MAHDKDYYDYMPHQEEESHEHRSMSFEDDLTASDNPEERKYRQAC